MMANMKHPSAYLERVRRGEACAGVDWEWHLGGLTDARLAQELGDLAIAIATVLPSKLHNVGGETLLVLTTARDLALCRAMLPERRTGATLGDMQLRSQLLNAGTATRGA